ncbi:MAG: DinB family protein [Candidatus Heimdallarchaeota archaeon]|nr:MAG: DinB family protein [Candidatus Heimdallarchaeota archaeon]
MNPNRQERKIGPIISKEFQNSWNMLRQAVENISDEFWLTTINEWSFSWTIYHIIETAEFYSHSTPLGMEWGKYAGINWEVDSEDEINKKKSLITKEVILNYLEDIEKRISNYFTNVTDYDLFDTDGFDNGNLYVIEKMIYLLRHNMHHIGELNKVLRDSNCQRISWR